MKKFIFALALAPLLLAQSLIANQYLGGNFGTDFCHLTSDSNSGNKVGYRLGASYGYYFESGFRPELEFTYRQNHFSTKYQTAQEDQVAFKRYRSFHSWALMANVLYDVKALTLWQITPYIGVGVGYAHNVEHDKIKGDQNNTMKKHDDRFAYQAIVGAKYPIQEGLLAAMQYNYCLSRDHAKNHDISMHLIKNF